MNTRHCRLGVSDSSSKVDGELLKESESQSGLYRLYSLYLSQFYFRFRVIALSVVFKNTQGKVVSSHLKRTTRPISNFFLTLVRLATDLTLAQIKLRFPFLKLTKKTSSYITHDSIANQTFFYAFVFFFLS